MHWGAEGFGGHMPGIGIIMKAYLALALCACVLGSSYGIPTKVFPWQQYGADPAHNSNSHLANYFPGPWGMKLSDTVLCSLDPPLPPS